MKQTQKNFLSYLRPILTGALAGMSLAIAFTAGFVIRDFVPVNSPLIHAASPENPGYPLVDEVQALLDQTYLREQPDYATRQYAAIRGLLQSLDDPNTFFIEPPVAQSEAQALAGTYGGIGVLLQRNEEGAFVIYPFDDSPAAAAGVDAGALLLAVDGEPIDMSDQPDAVDQLLRGEVTEGNGVTLTILQDGEEQELFVEFAVINVPSVVWRVLTQDERLGYIQILRFTSRTPDELQAALSELLDAAVQGLILDLRDNGGGLLDEAIRVAGQFLDDEVVIYEVTQDAERSLDAPSGGLATDIPLVVLVNGRTASASELVAGALQDHGRGILVGQRTFGKGTVQQIFTLSDGSSVHITSAEWLTPNRSPIAGVGLLPDIEMIPDEDGRDVELGQAIDYLQQQLSNDNGSAE